MSLFANGLLVALSLVMGLRLVRQYQSRPRPHTLWYAIGLLLTALAAGAEVWAQSVGALPTMLWWLYWVSASSLVGFLAVGTAYLLGSRTGHVALALALVLTAWLAAAVVATAGVGPSLVAESTLTKAPNATIKLPFLLQNILGALLILGGALWSYIRTRAPHNLLIALGTLVFSSGGAVAGFLHIPAFFYFTQSVGIVLLYLGVSNPTAGARTNRTVAN